jgi:uroporphyrinogen-III decarboxylase
MMEEIMVSNRERYKAIARFERAGDLWLSDAFWLQTLTAWIRNGAPEALMAGPRRGAYFEFGYTRTTYEIISGLGALPFTAGGTTTFMPIPPIVPRFEPKIVEEDGNTMVIINHGGQTAKVLKNQPMNMPMYLDHPVKDWDTWKEYKKRLDPDEPRRWPANWDAYVDKMNSRDMPLILNVGGFFGFLREWMGMTSLLYTFYDDPPLIEDMMETLLDLTLGVIDRALPDLNVDQANFWEDMCYKAGPLISPAMFKKYMAPRYRQVTDRLRKHGVDIIYVDSDGNIEKLVPLWLEAGVNMVWPVEIAAGNDPVALRKEYGKDLILGGGIDKRALLGGRESIEKEVMSKVPYLLDQGGYFPCIDHLVPPDITLENYQYYVNCLRRAADLEEIDFTDRPV